MVPVCEQAVVIVDKCCGLGRDIGLGVSDGVADQVPNTKVKLAALLTLAALSHTVPVAWAFYFGLAQCTLLSPVYLFYQCCRPVLFQCIPSLASPSSLTDDNTDLLLNLVPRPPFLFPSAR